MANSWMELEGCLLKTSHELLASSARNQQKMIERELGLVVKMAKKSLLEVKKKKKNPDDCLDQLEKQIVSLKRKLSEAQEREEYHLKRCGQRVDYLSRVDSSSSSSSLRRFDSRDLDNWAEIRTNRLVADYLYRNEMFDLASRVVEATAIEDFVDSKIFLDAKKVLDALKEKKLNLPLMWCVVNRAQLRKIKSTIEFNLRIQELIELIRNKKHKQGIEYARKHFVTTFFDSPSHLKVVQRVMGSLAFSRVCLGGERREGERKEGERERERKEGEREGERGEGREGREEEREGREGREEEREGGRERGRERGREKREREKRGGERGERERGEREREREREREEESGGEGRHPFGSRYLGPANCVDPYQDLYDMKRWDDLIVQFRKDSLAAACLSSKPLLLYFLSAGIVALKTSECDEQCDSHNTLCPTCFPLIREYGKELPSCNRSTSSIVCRISGDVMDEHNPPLVLPNGNVYSEKALTTMAKKNEGKITCPKTNQTYSLSQTSKVFLV